MLADFVVRGVRSEQGTEEMFDQKVFSSGATAMAVSARLRRAAMCADNTVKLVELGGGTFSAYKELYDESMVLDDDGGSLNGLQWTKDGQILTVTSSSGTIYNFLASLPLLAATHGTKYMYLTSLLELSVIDTLNRSMDPLVVAVAMEPDFAVSCMPALAKAIHAFRHGEDLRAFILCCRHSGRRTWHLA